MKKIKIITVFRNEHMYNNFFLLNMNLLQFKVEGFDNRMENFGLPKIYNSVIEENLNKEVWLFFVHEDFEIKGQLDHIRDLDPLSVYGTFGVKMENGVPVGVGKHVCSNKDGSNAVEAGLLVDGVADVQSLDCQSILLHTSLLNKYQQLRFDENLSFDLYAEDFCINAGCVLNIPIRVFSLEFQHYSHGKITKRYYDGLEYLARKYPNYGVPGSCSFIGGLADELSKTFRYNIQAGG